MIFSNSKNTRLDLYLFHIEAKSPEMQQYHNYSPSKIFTACLNQSDGVSQSLLLFEIAVCGIKLNYGTVCQSVISGRCNKCRKFVIKQ